MEKDIRKFNMETGVVITSGDRIDGQETITMRPQDVLKIPIEALNLSNLGRTSYVAVGHCIYCSETDNLKREHIIPFGLNGTAVLPMATCQRCANITGAFEAQVLRGPMRAVRVLRRLRSRSKHRDVPRLGTLTIVRKGITAAVKLPLEEYPILLHFPVFSPPSYLAGDEEKPGIRINGVATVCFGPAPQDVATRLGAQEVVLNSQPDYPVSFAGMIAKIAYSMAFADGILKCLADPPFIIPAILGVRDEIGRWVGTLNDPIRKYPGLLHRIVFHKDREHRLLIGEVQLFSDSETPSYGVILGRLKEDE